MSVRYFIRRTGLAALVAATSMVGTACDNFFEDEGPPPMFACADEPGAEEHVDLDGDGHCDIDHGEVEPVVNPKVPPPQPVDPGSEPPAPGEPGEPVDPGSEPPAPGEPGEPVDPGSEPPAPGEPGEPVDPGSEPPAPGEPGEPTEPIAEPCAVDSHCSGGDELCIDGICQAPTCGDFTDEASCLGYGQCQPVYSGIDCIDAAGGECTSGDTECTCASFVFGACVAAELEPLEP